MKKNVLVYTLLLVMGVLSSCGGAEKNGTAKQSAVKGDGSVTFYFVRHGKTMLNTLDRVQGWADAPLTPPGIEVAKYLGLGLQDVEFKSAYASDLGRARQTARIVLDANGQKELDLIEVSDLRETNFGSYEGDFNKNMWTDASKKMGYKTLDAMMKDFPNKPNLLSDMLTVVQQLDTLAMAENYTQVKERGQKVIREIAEKEAKQGGGNILVVSHGMALGIFLSDLDSDGKKPESAHMGNAAVCKVVYKDGKFTLETFDDMSYVDKGKSLSKN